MKIRRLILVSSILLGTISTAAAAKAARAVEPLLQATEAAVVAGAELSLDHSALVAKMLSRWSEDAAPRFSTQPAGEPQSLADGGSGTAATACGSSVGVASPPNGISGQGTGGDMVTALFFAWMDAQAKCLAYANIECQDCQIPGACTPGVDLLDTEWTWDAFQVADGTWYAVMTYKGPILAYCTPCE